MKVGLRYMQVIFRRFRKHHKRQENAASITFNLVSETNVRQETVERSVMSSIEQQAVVNPSSVIVLERRHKKN